MPSANLYKNQESNVFRTWFLMTAFLVFVIFLGWSISYYYNSSGILYFFVAFAFLMNFFSYWFSDKVVLKLHKAKEATREEYFDLWNATENLSIAAGLPMPKLYVIEDRAPNAFATGRNKDHSAVAVTTGLLAILDKSELEGVIAHELSHIGNRDILLSTVVVVLVGFVSLAADAFMRAQIFGGRNNDNKSGGALILVGIVLSVLSPLIATIIQLAISRRREFLADASGALLTRYPEGLASALRKISAGGVQMRTAKNATAHMFISNPFGGKKMSGMHKLFMTHPPTEERIQALLGQNK